MSQSTTEEFHLFEFKEEKQTSYLLVKNIFPDPRSIKENIYEALTKLVSEQLDLLVQYYLKNTIVKKCSYQEIGTMEGLPIGDDLYQNKINEALDIKLIRGERNYCVFGTANSKAAFLNEYKEDIDTYGEGYANLVEEYNVYYMPITEFTNLSDISNHFSWCTTYDYENQKWIE